MLLTPEERDAGQTRYPSAHVRLNLHGPILPRTHLCQAKRDIEQSETLISNVWVST